MFDGKQIFDTYDDGKSFLSIELYSFYLLPTVIFFHLWLTTCDLYTPVTDTSDCKIYIRYTNNVLVTFNTTIV